MTTRRHFVGALGTLLTPSVWALPLTAGTARLRLAVIIAKSSPLETISLQDLRNLYRGDRLVGHQLIPFAFQAGTPERIAFDHSVLGMSPDDVARYWIDRKIRGQSGPPRAIDNPDLLMRVVAKLDGGLGYVRASDVKDYVKVLRIDSKGITDSAYPIEY
jgi:hypothetical protein